MANHANITPRNARPIHPAIVQAALSAEAAKTRVERLAGILEKLMEEIHGGDWRVSIEHGADAAFVLVAPRSECRQRPRSPQPEVA